MREELAGRFHVQLVPHLSNLNQIAASKSQILLSVRALTLIKRTRRITKLRSQQLIMLRTKTMLMMTRLEAFILLNLLNLFMESF